MSSNSNGQEYNPRSGQNRVAAADAGTMQLVVPLTDDESFALSDYTIQYLDAATVGPVLVEVHDDDGTGDPANVGEDEAIDIIEVDIGERVRLDGLHRSHVDNGVSVIVDRAGAGADGDMLVTVSGDVVTS